MASNLSFATRVVDDRRAGERGAADEALEERAHHVGHSEREELLEERREKREEAEGSGTRRTWLESIL